ncbi:MAG: tRNA epoxyqueuosine(34) reductase QueG [Culturomica sp.]|jgi:epoxyqueuosine reductase|nr:tRNA epoxyqueuosine(34) reductase QueG [Culturomica sp.]
MLQSSFIKQQAATLGFDAVGIAKVTPLPERRLSLESWLAQGCNGEMTYMENNVEKRENPALLVENAQSVVVTLMNYYTDNRQSDGSPRIARYAYGKDYHAVIKNKLQQLKHFVGGRCFVDSAPVFEKEWARRAGLGWIGKNNLFISKTFGSFVLIGVIVTPEAFDSYDEPFDKVLCGSCKRCIDACPTEALSPYMLDARKCIAYDTIEKRQSSAINNLNGNIFGCDRCQEVCPCNADLKTHSHPEFQITPEVVHLSKQDWKDMNEEKFHRLFDSTPLERTGLQHLQENLSKL